MSSRQLAEWEAYYMERAGQIKPAPPDLSPDELAAQIDALLAKAG